MKGQERVVALSVSTALLMTGQGVVGPVLPVFARRFGVSLAAVGMTVAAFGLARLLLNIPLGSLSDRWGRRFLLVGGPLIVAVSMVGTGLAGGIVSLTIWRFGAGAGSSMYMTGALIYLTDISSLSNRGRMIGFNQGALLLGQSIGPGMGGLLAANFGLRSPFFFIAGASLVAGIYGFFRLPETLPAGGRNAAGAKASNRGALVRLVKSPAFLAVAAVNFAIFFTRASTRATLLPLAGTDLFGLGVGQVGLLLSAMAVINLVFLPPAAAASDRFGRAPVITPSMVLTAAALIVLALAGDVAMFVTGSLILAVATSVAGPAPAALAADTVPSEIRGVSLGVFRTVGDLGLLLGPPILGFAADAGGFGLAFGVNAALVGLITVGFFVVSRRIAG